MKLRNKILVGSLLVGSFFLSKSALADGDIGSTAVTTFNTDMGTINTLITTTEPIAVGTAVFGAGMMMVKRLIYS